MHEGKASLAERLWRRTSLVQRLTFVALMPMSLTAILLVTLLTRHQLESLREMGRITADAIASQAASISAEPLQQMQRRELGRIAATIGHLPHVTHVQIRALDGEIVADQDSDVETGAATTTVIRDIVGKAGGPRARAR